MSKTSPLTRMHRSVCSRVIHCTSLSESRIYADYADFKSLIAVSVFTGFCVYVYTCIRAIKSIHVILCDNPRFRQSSICVIRVNLRFRQCPYCAVRTPLARFCARVFAFNGKSACILRLGVAHKLHKLSLIYQ